MGQIARGLPVGGGVGAVRDKGVGEGEGEKPGFFMN